MVVTRHRRRTVVFSTGMSASCSTVRAPCVVSYSLTRSFINNVAHIHLITYFQVVVFSFRVLITAPSMSLMVVTRHRGTSAFIIGTSALCGTVRRLVPHHTDCLVYSLIALRTFMCLHICRWWSCFLFVF